jgi:adenine-specific DNA-methyltransferase
MRLKKRRGVFYTPAELADVLVEWGIRSSADLILEPSFGGCEFIASAQKRLLALGNKNASTNIYGCDIDRLAFRRHLAHAVGRISNQQHFIKADFLSLTPKDFKAPQFDIVIGNPPYVSYHNMFKTQRLAASRIGHDSEFRLSGRASLWAYFVFHSLQFLKQNGRMAWLLPGSLLHASYAKELLHELGRRFARVAVVSLGERMFLREGVSETTELLFCEGYRQLCDEGAVEVIQASDIVDCARHLQRWGANGWKGTSLNGRAGLALLGPEKLSAFTEIAEGRDVVRFEDLADITIGIVTGANRIFIVNQDAAAERRIPVTALIPILAKSSAAPGLRLSRMDVVDAISRGIPSLLVDGARAKQSEAVRSYFAAVPKIFREKNVTFRKHSDWRCPDDNRIPDAFFPYMHHAGPRLVLNVAQVNATNTIHRVYFKARLTNSRRRLIALTLLSTFSQVSAEIEGRSYGAGVLKHEPGEARKIRLILPDLPKVTISTLFEHIDRLLRKGLSGEATAAVDRELLHAMRDTPAASKWASLQSTLTQLRASRYKRPVPQR